MPRYAQYTVDTLIDGIRRRAGQGSNPPALNDTSLLALMNEEVTGWLVPTLLQGAEGRFVHYVDVALRTVAGLPGQVIDIPQDAWGTQIRSMAYVDANGNPLASLSLEMDPGFTPATAQPNAFSPGAYFLSATQLCVLSSGAASGTVRIWYYRVPSLLTRVANPSTPGLNSGLNLAQVNEIASISGTGPFTVTMTQPLVSPFAGAASNVDFVQAREPFSVLAANQTPSGSGASTLQFATIPSNLAVGDYVCLPGYAPVIVDVPYAIYPHFAQWCAAKVLEARGDDAGIKRAEKLSAGAATGLEQILEPRNTAAERYVTNGLYRSGGGYWWGWRRG